MELDAIADVFNIAADIVVIVVGLGLLTPQARRAIAKYLRSALTVEIPENDAK
jgi:hypothetical protein